MSDTAELARRAVEHALQEAIMRAPLLAVAADALTCMPRKGPALATDGAHLFFDPKGVTDLMRELRWLPTHEVTHLICHLLLLHPFDARSTDPWRYDLACDVVATRAVTELLGERSGAKARARQRLRDSFVRDLPQPLSRTRILMALEDRQWSDRLERQAQAFRADDHTLWHEPHQGGGADAVGAGRAGGSAPADGVGTGQSRAGTAGTPESAAMRERWAQISRQTLSEAAREQMAGTLVREMGRASRRRRDYASFVSAFCARTEEERPSEVDFDPIFYTLGLTLYGDLPLIEPLELAERRGAATLAVVIDTSASIGESTLTRLLDVTFDVVSALPDHAPWSVLVIQADAAVQSETLIASRAELRRWRKEVQGRGFGGTDFRPAIERVAERSADGTLRGLRGLIYLTDGFGTYPASPPAFPVAFVYTDPDHPKAPDWVVQHTLRDDDLMTGAF